MIGKRYGKRFVLFLALFVATFLFVVAQPAGATGSSWIRWLVEINYSAAANDIDMQFIVQRGHMTQTGQYVIDDEHSESVPCQAVGNPLVHNGGVTLDGNSYYICAAPSAQQIASDKWGILIPDTCTVSKKPFVTGQITLEDVPVQSDPENPILYRDDIYFATPLDVPAQEAELTVRFDQASASSNSFTVDPAGHMITARFNKISPNQYAPAFLENGTSLAATPASVSGPIILSNLESTIYVGYSPVSKEYFEGDIGPIRADPVCTGHG